MQKVPNIVRDRLKAAQPAVNHPDADLLTAFSEQSLSERERNVVLDHLARCADCRDVIALALPATETLETAVRPARSPWLTWPALRWGFVAAGVVVIASLGILQYQRHAQQSTMMALKSPAIAVPESRPQTSAPAQPPPVSQQSENQDKAQAASSAFANSESGQNLVVEPKPMARAAIPPAAP